MPAPEGFKEVSPDDPRLAVPPGFKRVDPADPRLQGDGLFRTVDDFVRAVASGLTFGFADEIAAVFNTTLGSRTFGENVAMERARDEAAHPVVRIPGEVTGALLMGGGLARGGLSLLAGARPTAASVAGRGAAEGAIFGGLFGAGTAEGGLAERAAGAAQGAAVGAVTGGITGAIGGTVAARRQGERIAQAAKQIKDEAQTAYRLAEQAGVVVKGDAVRLLRKTMIKRLQNEGLDKGLQPRIIRVLERIDEAADADNVTLEGMEILRRVARNAGSSPNADERRLAGILVEEIDDFVSNLANADVLIGNVRQGVVNLEQARKLWAVGSKTEAIAEMVERAGNRAGQFTGSGFENALRTEFRQLVQNPRRLRRFTRVEQSFIRRVAKGTPLGNALRALGRFAPRGVVSTVLTGGAGAAIGGPAGAGAAMLAGEAGRLGATASTQRQVGRAVESIVGPTIQQAPQVSPRLSGGLSSLIAGAQAALN